jgi:hypothetical protein
MPTIKRYPARAGLTSRTQSGVVAVEFGLIAFCFFLFIFGTLEVARMLYLWNTLQEVTRRAARAAAVADFTNTAAMDALRQSAMFRASPGTLALGAPLTDAHILIDYMWLLRNADGSMALQPIPSGALPASPLANIINCINDPYAATCIRFVRARICQPGGDGDPNECAPVAYQPLTGLLSLPVNFNLPTALTVVKAETLGY